MFKTIKDAIKACVSTVPKKWERYGEYAGFGAGEFSKRAMRTEEKRLRRAMRFREVPAPIEVLAAMKLVEEGHEVILATSKWAIEFAAETDGYNAAHFEAHMHHLKWSMYCGPRLDKKPLTILIKKDKE